MQEGALLVQGVLMEIAVGTIPGQNLGIHSRGAQQVWMGHPQVLTNRAPALPGSRNGAGAPPCWRSPPVPHGSHRDSSPELSLPALSPLFTIGIFL